MPKNITAEEARAIASKAQGVYNVYDAIRIASARGSHFLRWTDTLLLTERDRLAIEGYKVDVYLKAGGSKTYVISWSE